MDLFLIVGFECDKSWCYGLIGMLCFFNLNPDFPILLCVPLYQYVCIDVSNQSIWCHVLFFNMVWCFKRSC